MIERMNTTYFGLCASIYYIFTTYFIQKYYIFTTFMQLHWICRVVVDTEVIPNISTNEHIYCLFHCLFLNLIMKVSSYEFEWYLLPVIQYPDPVGISRVVGMEWKYHVTVLLSRNVSASSHTINFGHTTARVLWPLPQIIKRIIIQILRIIDMSVVERSSKSQKFQ